VGCLTCIGAVLAATALACAVDIAVCESIGKER